MSFQFTYQTSPQETYVQEVLHPRAYVLSSNTENIIVQSPYPEARISLINSTATSNSSNIDRYIISSSSNQLSILNTFLYGILSQNKEFRTYLYNTFTDRKLEVGNA